MGQRKIAVAHEGRAQMGEEEGEEEGEGEGGGARYKKAQDGELSESEG